MSFLVDNIEFFDTKGNNLNPNYKDGVYKFEVMFERTSTSLFSTNQIHILEKCINVVTEQSSLTKPKTTDSQKFKVAFKDKNYENFMMFRVDFSNRQFYIETVTNSSNVDLQTQEYSYQNVNSVQDQYVANGKTLAKNEIFPEVKKVVSNFTFDLEPTTEIVGTPTLTTESSITNDLRNIVDHNDSVDGVTINLAVSSEAEGEFEEVLEIYLVTGDEEELLAEVNLYAEVVGEDERFTNLLQNLGEELNEEDSIVFRESSVLEDYKDEIVLNKKKKELILEYSNLIPYIGSYKGLINALKFYGYGDLRIKEYWLNLGTEQYFQEEIPSDTFKQPKRRLSYNPQLKKTGKFSLTYDITRVKSDGSVDSNGLPEVEEVDIFSQEEILIKLFGLKELLKRKFLPLNTRIVDITGEYVTFKYTKVSYNTQNLETLKINDFDYDFKIEATPQFSTLSNVYVTKNNIFPLSNSMPDNSVALNEIRNFKVEDFKHYDAVTYDTSKRDSYSTIELTNKTFELLVSDLGGTFEDLDSTGNLYTFESVNSGDFYEIEWEVSKQSSPAYYKRIAGNVNSFNTVQVSVPYAGEYDVTVTLHDVYNNYVVRRNPRLFRVELPEPEFGIVYLKTKRLGTFEESTDLQMDVEFLDDMDWDFTYTNTTQIQDADVTFESIDPRNYIASNSFDMIETRGIVSIDRNTSQIYLEKQGNDNIKKIASQKYLNFIKEYKSSDKIKGFEVLSYDANASTIEIASTNLIDDGDFIEISTRKTIDDFEIFEDENKIVVNEVLRSEIKEGCYVGLENSSVHYFIPVEKVRIDKTNSTTTLWLNDPDYKVFNKTFDSMVVHSRFFSFEVTEVVEQKDNSVVYKIDWNGLSLPRTNGLQYNDKVLGGQVTLDLYDMIKATDNLKDIGKVKDYINYQRSVQLPALKDIPLYLSDETVKLYLKERVFENGGVLGMMEQYVKENQKTSSTEIAFPLENYEFLQSLSTMGVATGEKIVARWNMVYGKRSIKVESINVDKFSDRIQVTLNDYDKELFQVTKNFKVEVANYDIEYARRYCGLTSYGLDNLNFVGMEEVDLVFDDVETIPPTLPTFTIMNPRAGARLKIGNSEQFTFSDSCAGNVDIAIQELYSSSIPEFDMYSYSKVNATTINVTSKFEIENSLNIIEFSGLDVSPKISPRYAHNYPLPRIYETESDYKAGTKRNRNFNNKLISSWIGVGETPFIEEDLSIPEFYDSEDYNTTFQKNLAHAITGNFRFDNTNITKQAVQLDTMTKCYFYGDVSPIWGKTLYKWTIYNGGTGDVLIESNSERLVWTFPEEGMFDVELEVTDNKGNTSSKRKNSFVVIKNRKYN